MERPQSILPRPLAAPTARLVALLVAGTALLSSAGAPAGAQTLADRVDELVRREMARQKIPGVAVAVVTRTGIPVLAGYGFANVEHSVPVGPQTIFQSGSVGKQFTAALVMTLVEEGRVGLDDSIRKYFPDAPESWQAIEIRHLLSHTSGLPDYTTDAFDYHRDYSEDELRRIAYALELEFSPGTRWSYSNTGYVILGALVRRVTGRFYGDLLEERIFDPLGMQTARVISEAEIVPHRAAGYRLEDGELRNQEWVAPSLNTTADGALYLSLLDLVRWDAGLRAEAILRPETWAEIQRPVRLASGKPYPYGFGWSVDGVAGTTRVHHGGAWQGFQTYISRFPAEGLTVIVLANLAGADLAPIVDGATRLVDPALVPPDPPPPPEDPAVTARLRDLLRAAAEGRLRREELAYVRAGFFPGLARWYQELLSEAGEVRSMRPLRREELGDDVVYRFEVEFARGGAFLVGLGLAPDGKVSAFGIRRRD